MVVNDRIASYRQLAVRWYTATGVLMSASSIRWHLLQHELRARMLLYKIPLTETTDGSVCNGFMSTAPGKLICTKLFFLMNHASVCGIIVAADDDRDGLPECVIEGYSGLTPGVMVWGAVSCHGRSDLLQIEDNLNSNR
ncbi:HTH_Tnp_Tc3_2 domain-containing protein [Trichonephila clavipes]|nr:HTH_Tnp_Tc3_2 domain-containing protein [Trichonephila clavipes]